MINYLFLETLTKYKNITYYLFPSRRHSTHHLHHHNNTTVTTVTTPHCPNMYRPNIPPLTINYINPLVPNS